MHTRGCKIETNKDGMFEITYFGKFSTCETSQTLIIENEMDLKYLHAKIETLLKEGDIGRE